MEAKERMVRGLELFSECSRDEVEWVLHNGDVVDLAPGTVLAHQGGYAKEFMVVVEGAACASTDDGAVVTLLPGSFFGHEEIAVDRPHVATIEAKDRVRVLVFEIRAFRGFDECVPTVARKLAGESVRRVPALRYGRRLAVAS